MRKKPSATERRINPRMSLNAYMQLVVFNKEAPGMLRAQDLLKQRIGLIRNISSTGVGVETNDLEEAWIAAMLSGVILVALEFKIPNYKEPVDVITKVAWVKHEKQSYQYRYAIGLKFMDISMATRTRIRRFVISNKLANKKK